MMTNQKSFSPELHALPDILSWVRARLEETGLSGRERYRVELALEEGIVNIITHSGIQDKLIITCQIAPKRQVVFELIDSGQPFNPLEHVQQPDEQTPLEERSLGGLGIVLMRNTMDALLYRREGEQNILTLVKNL